MGIVYYRYKIVKLQYHKEIMLRDDVFKNILALFYNKSNNDFLKIK